MLDVTKIFNSGSGAAVKTAEAYRDGKSVSAFGLCSFAKAAVTALSGEYVRESGENAAAAIITGDFYLARAFYDSLSRLEDGVYLLPARDDALSYRDALSGENVTTRLKTLAAIATGRARYVVCPVEAAMQPFPRRERFAAACVTIEKGKDYDLTELASRLVRAGYKRETQISDSGTFAVRGDILDVWSVGEQRPVRVEFFDTQAESIRYFDEENQLSKEHADSYDVTPATEFMASDEECRKILERLDEYSAATGLEPDYAAKARELIGTISARVSAGDKSVALGYLLPLTETVGFFDFCRASGVIYDEVKQIVDNANVHAEEHQNRFAALLSRGETLPFTRGGVIPYTASLKFDGRRLAFQNVNNANRIFKPNAVFSFRTTETPAYHRDFRLLAADVKNWLSRDYTVYLCAPDDGLLASVKDFLAEARLPVSDGYGSGGVRIIKENTLSGAAFHDYKIVVVGTDNLRLQTRKKTIKRGKSNVFNQPKPGDYVVHELHGVGRFDGVVKLDVGGVRRDYLLVTYAGNDKLYVPVENMDSLSRYTADGAEPKLSKIGGADFAKVKEKVRKSVRELAVNLAELYGERKEGKGYRYSADDTLLHEFEGSCGFTETDDQLAAIEDGLNDLKSGKIMDRLLCGDVGYGKTEVALRLAFKVISEGKQVAFMSPTTILAKQHFETVKRRMEPFGVTAVRLTRFDTKAEQAAAAEKLRAGKADIAVGTHRLLSKDIDFADLGLLILDEEQRFGVGDKEKIKDVKRGVNVLTLSATPIPRTLHMSLTGMRDISVLDTPPSARIPVQTYVTEYGEALVVDAITREINRGGQVFVVYNRVSDIDRFAARIQSLVPSAKVTYAHGQMREDVLERTVEAFVDGKTDVLVSSTIIENGIDIARANTMIVVDSDRLGLAQLYQLRGRVGRSDRLAYVFFTYDGRKALSDDAYKRLEAITQFTEFGSGFRIAMRDLEIRGAGTVLGAEQHGHMEKVGYDLYCRMLREAVGEMRGEKRRERKEVRAVTDYGIFVPESYIKDKDWRLRVYSRIAAVDSMKERDSVLGDLGDVYGAVPDSVKNLVDVALIKNLAGNIGADKVTLKRDETSVGFNKIADMDARVVEASRGHGGMLNAASAAISFPSAAKMLKFLLDCDKIDRSND